MPPDAPVTIATFLVGSVIFRSLVSEVRQSRVRFAKCPLSSHAPRLHLGPPPVYRVRNGPLACSLESRALRARFQFLIERAQPRSGRLSMRSIEHALEGLPLYGGNAFVHFGLPITQVLTIGARPEVA